MSGYVDLIHARVVDRAHFNTIPLPSEWVGRVVMHIADLMYVADPQDCIDVLSNLACRVYLFVGCHLPFWLVIIECGVGFLFGMPWLLLGQTPPFEAQLNRSIEGFELYGNIMYGGLGPRSPLPVRHIYMPDAVFNFDFEEGYRNHIQNLTEQAIIEISQNPELYSLFDDAGNGWQEKFRDQDAEVFVRVSYYVVYKEIREQLRLEHGERLIKLNHLQAQLIHIRAAGREEELVQQILGQNGETDDDDDPVNKLFKGIGALGGDLHQGPLKEPFFKAFKNCLAAK